MTESEISLTVQFLFLMMNWKFQDIKMHLFFGGCKEILMKKIQLVNEDYEGHVDVCRHACRGIVIKDGKILLSYESNEDKYIIPGGGVEEGETFAECCAREIKEETGMIVKPIEEYLEIEEFFLNWQHIQHYFLCEFVEDTGTQALTDAEIKNGDVPRWIRFEDAVGTFGRYEEFHDINIADYGLYRREFLALKALRKSNIFVSRKEDFGMSYVKRHIMRLTPSPLKMIREGTKTIELRLLDDKRKGISVGDTIVFVNTEDENDILSVMVDDLYRFDSFEELYKNLPLLECGYTEEDIDSASPKDMELYYSKEEQEQYGVVGIKVSLIIGKSVKGIIDRPAGSHHPRHPEMIYPINYGFVEGIMAPDGAEQDVYVLGTDEPIKSFEGKVIAVYHRSNDVEDKWIVSIDGRNYTDEELLKIIDFQEQYFKGRLLR